MRLNACLDGSLIGWKKLVYKLYMISLVIFFVVLRQSCWLIVKKDVLVYPDDSYFTPLIPDIKTWMNSYIAKFSLWCNYSSIPLFHGSYRLHGLSAITWTSMSAIQERPLNWITHSPHTLISMGSLSRSYCCMKMWLLIHALNSMLV